MKRIVLLAVVASLVSVEVAEAQRHGDRHRDGVRGRMERRVAPQTTIGVRGLYDFDTRDFGIGGHGQLPLGRLLRLAPSVEVYLGETTTWQVNADVMASLLLLRGGLGLALVDGARTGDPAVTDPQLGLNLFAGLQSPRRRGVRPFVDARWTYLEDETPLRLVAGVNVPIGPRR
jgi:hypothetical protein